MKIYNILASEIKGCVVLPLDAPCFELSLTTLCSPPEMRVFQCSVSGAKNDVTHIFFPDGVPLPTAENIAKAVNLVRDALDYIDLPR